MSETIGTAVNILNDTQTVSAPPEYNKAVVETVEKASDNPDRACEMINDIDDSSTYEEALRTVLDLYYLESDTKSSCSGCLQTTSARKFHQY